MELPEMPNKVCYSVDTLYSNSKTLRILFALETGTSLLAILCLFLLIFLLIAWKMFNSNIRIIFGGFSLALLFSNISIMLSSIYHLQAIIVRPKDSRCYWLSFNYGDCYCKFCLHLNPRKFWRFVSIIIFPNLIELKQFYFILVGIELFSLASYSTLLLHGFTLTMESRMRKITFQIHESMTDTEVTFPVVVTSIFFFVINLCLDRNFWMILQSFFNQTWIQENRTISVVAFWNEIQSLSIPIFSLIFFVLTVRHVWKVDSEKIYDKTLSECAQSLKMYYETLNIQKSPNLRRTRSSEDIYKTEEKNQEDTKSKTLPNFRKNNTKGSPELSSKNNPPESESAKTPPEAEATI